MDDELPTGLEHVRTTAVFDHENHPAGLRREHRVAEGVWARLVVHAGALEFVFGDAPDAPRRVEAGGSVVIPPGRPHHLDLPEPVAFALEFHRDVARPDPAAGDESTGLA
ncbi:MAG: DUF1971 domain-containing protein [Acidimicrobiales bacterium]